MENIGGKLATPIQNRITRRDLRVPGNPPKIPVNGYMEEVRDGYSKSQYTF